MATRFFQSAWRYTDQGQQMQCGLSFFGDDAALDFTPMSAQGLADKLGGTSALVTAFRALLRTDATLDAVVVRELLAPGSTDVPDEGSHTIGLAGSGTVGDTAIPDACCAVLATHTNAAVRGGVGRMFLPPLRGTAWINDDSVSSTYQALVATWIAELGHFNKGGSAWAGGSWGAGVYSRTRRARGATQFAFTITSYQLKTPVTWLRSRRRLKA